MNKNNYLFKNKTEILFLGVLQLVLMLAGTYCLSVRGPSFIKTFHSICEEALDLPDIKNSFNFLPE